MGATRLDWQTSPEHLMLSATFCTLTFTTQKNSVAGEVVGQSHSGHTHFCPVLCLACCLLHLCQHGATPDTPLMAVYPSARSGPKAMTSKALTVLLRHAITDLGPAHGMHPLDASTSNLCTSGATALLCARIDTDLICLIGWWCSDAMLRYLYVATLSCSSPYAANMLAHGDYQFH